MDATTLFSILAGSTILTMLLAYLMRHNVRKGRSRRYCIAVGALATTPLLWLAELAMLADSAFRSRVAGDLFGSLVLLLFPPLFMLLMGNKMYGWAIYMRGRESGRH